jgi:Glycosyl hydrolase family 47
LFFVLTTLCRADQTNPQTAPLDKAQMAEKIRQEFLFTWNAYKKYAWGHDMVKPLSKGHCDWHEVPLYLTAVDSMDTLYLMGFKEEGDKAREFVATNLSFDHDIHVKNYEMVIRILGGLLSIYQITGDKRLLVLAEDLGNRLLPVFKSETGMPYTHVDFKTGAVQGEISNPTEIGSLLLELGTLSKLTGKPIYYDKAKRAMVELYNRRSSIGLVGSTIDVRTGKWIDPTGGFSNFHKTLLQCDQLFGDKDCAQMWQTSIVAINKYVADDSATGFWYGQANMFTGKRMSTFFSAGGASFAATLASSGDLARAKHLQDAAYKMWPSFGMDPEKFDYQAMKIIDPRSVMRGGAVESAYYLYYYTKDPRYLEMGQTFLDALIRYCKVEAGYAELWNLKTKERNDEMQTFFMASTLKYLYLLYAPPETIDLSKTVFSLEAHPLKRTW